MPVGPSRAGLNSIGVAFSGPDIGSIASGLAKANQILQRFAGAVTVWRAATAAGIALVGVSFIRLARQAVASAAVLDAAFREVATLLPGTAEDVDQLRRELVKLSTTTGAPPELLSAALYQVVSAGVTNTAEAFVVLEAAARSAVAGLTTTETAVDAITTTLNAYQLNATEATRVSDIFFTTVREGKLRFTDIASVIGDVATSASLVGVSVAETGAALATLTKFGLTSQIAATSLNRLFLSLANSTEAQRKAASRLGFEFTTTNLRTKGLVGFMRELNEATDGNIDALAQIIPQIRSFRGVAILAGNGLEEFSRISKETAASTRATALAFDEMASTLGFQGGLLRTRLNSLFSEFGQSIQRNVVTELEQLNFFLADNATLVQELAERSGDASRILAIQQSNAVKLLERQVADQKKNIKSDIEEIEGLLRSSRNRFTSDQLNDLFVGTGRGFLGDLQSPESSRFQSGVLNFFNRSKIDNAIEETINNIADASERGSDALEKQIEAERARLQILRLEQDERRREDKFAKVRLDLALAFLQTQRERVDLTRETEIQLQQANDAELQQIRLRLLFNTQALDSLKALSEVDEDIVASKDLQIRQDRARIPVIQELIRLNTLLEETGRPQFDREDILSDPEGAIPKIRAAGQQAIDVADALLKSRAALNERLAEGVNLTGQERVNIQNAIDALDITIGKQLDLNEAVNDLAGEGGTLAVLGQLLRGVIAGISEAVEEADLERAQKVVEGIRREFELLEKFGFKNLRDAPDVVRSAISELRGLDSDIVRIQEAIDVLGKRAAAEAVRKVEEIKATQEKIVADTISAVQDLITGVSREVDDGLLGNAADIVRGEQLLSDFGLTGLADIAPELNQAVQEFGRLTDEIEKFDTNLTRLNERRVRLRQELADADARAADLIRASIELTDQQIENTEAAIAILITQRNEYKLTADQLRKFADVLNDVPELAEVLPELTPEQEDALNGRIRAILFLRDALDDLRAQRETVASESERAIALDIEIAEAQDDLSNSTNELIKRLELLGGPVGRAIVNLLRAMGAEFETVEKTSKDFVRQLNAAISLARGVKRVADAFGDLGEELEDVIDGVIDLIDGLRNIAAFEVEVSVEGSNLTETIRGLEALGQGGLLGIATGLGAALQIGGGLAQLVGGLFGESPEERARRERLEENTLAIRNLTESMEARERLIGGLTGDQIEAIEAFGELRDPTAGGVSVRDLSDKALTDFVQRGVDAFKELGIGVDELAAISEATGIKFKGLTDLLVNGAALAEDVAIDLIALQELGAKGLTELLILLNDELGERQRSLQQRRQLFADEFEADPTLFLRTFQENLAKALPPEIAAQLRAFDLNTPEGRNAALSFIQGLFDRSFGENVFGELDPLEARQQFVDFGEAIREAGEDAEDGTLSTGGAVRTISEVTGNRIVGALTTISVINQASLRVQEEILLELGGQIPEDVQTISFRAPGAELDILEIEQLQLEVLQNILDAVTEIGVTAGLLAPTEEEVSAAAASTTPVAIQIDVAPGAFQGSSISTEEDADVFVARVVSRVDDELGARRLQRRRSRGRLGLP